MSNRAIANQGSHWTRIGAVVSRVCRIVHAKLTHDEELGTATPLSAAEVSMLWLLVLAVAVQLLGTVGAIPAPL